MVIHSQEKKVILSFSVIILCLLIIASLFDQQISISFANQNSLFGTIFQIFGMFPQQLVLFLSMEILGICVFLQYQNNFIRYLFLVFGLAFGFWAISIMVGDWMHYSNSALNNIRNGLPFGAANNDGGSSEHYSYMLARIITFIIWTIGTGSVYRWISRKDYSVRQELIKVAISGVAFYFVSSMLIENMKLHWGRFRPYEIARAIEGAHFTHWWNMNGINGHKSFPSGHTLSGMSAVFLTFFCNRNNIKKQKIITYITIFYGLIMGISRVRIGAHFLSDVTISAVLTFFIALFFAKSVGLNLIEEE